MTGAHFIHYLAIILWKLGSFTFTLTFNNLRPGVMPEKRAITDGINNKKATAINQS